MATSLLALIDDIASVLDDVAVLSKVAAKKTSGVLGDDLALNAEQVAGVRADRELPVVWAVAKGSFINKALLVPAALLISAFAPFAITVLLMIGGAYLCYEGFEKIAHKWLFHDTHKKIDKNNISQQDIDQVNQTLSPEQEKKKIKGAIRTDFILSAEIIVIILGTVQESPFTTQVITLSTLAILITVGVYGIVAAIVKIDDAGLYLLSNASDDAKGKIQATLGQGLLSFAPYLMKTLSVVGTVAMFMVGGGILLHSLPNAESHTHNLALFSESYFAAGSSISNIITSTMPTLVGTLLGLLTGAILVFIMLGIKKIKQ